MKIWILFASYSYDPSGADEVVAAFDHEPTAEELAPIEAKYNATNCRADYWNVVAREVVESPAKLPSIAEVLASPATHNWLKLALQSALTLDAVDVADDSELLSKLLSARADTMLGRTRPVSVGRSDGLGVVAHFATLADGEAHIVALSKVDPEGVEAGDYYIDAPEEMVNPPANVYSRRTHRSA